MISFPNTLPLDAVQLLIEAFKGKITDKKLRIQAAYSVVGYALSQVGYAWDLPKPTVLDLTREDTPKLPPTRDQILAQLEDWLTPAPKVSLNDMPWEEIARMVLKALLEEWLVT